MLSVMLSLFSPLLGLYGISSIRGVCVHLRNYHQALILILILIEVIYISLCYVSRFLLVAKISTLHFIHISRVTNLFQSLFDYVLCILSCLCRF